MNNLINKFVNSDSSESDSDSNSDSDNSYIDSNRLVINDEHENYLNLPPSFNGELNNIKKLSVIEKTNHLAINSIDRNLSDKFIHQFKYNLSLNSINQNNFSIISDLKNIISIELSHCILPNISIFTEERFLKSIRENKRFTNFQTLEDLPYITVHIEDIDNVWAGTNDNLKSCVAIMIPDDVREIHTNGFDNSNEITEEILTRKIITFRNIHENGKIFFPTPIDTLNSLFINYLDPHGNQLEIRDKLLNISGLRLYVGEDEEILPPQHLDKITLIMDNYFSRLEYKEGDRIFFKDFKIKKTNISNNTKFDIIFLEKYISRKEGHEITSLYTYRSGNFIESLNFKLLNCINISFPLRIDNKVGLIIPNYRFVTKGFKNTNNYAPVCDILYRENADAEGKIVNQYLETVSFWKINNKILDVNFNSKII